MPNIEYWYCTYIAFSIFTCRFLNFELLTYEPWDVCESKQPKQGSCCWLKKCATNFFWFFFFCKFFLRVPERICLCDGSHGYVKNNLYTWARHLDISKTAGCSGENLSLKALSKSSVGVCFLQGSRMGQIITTWRSWGKEKPYQLEQKKTNSTLWVLWLCIIQ